MAQAVGSLAIVAPASDQTSIDDAIVPALERNGITAKAIVPLSASGDRLTDESEMEALSERLKVEQIDTIIVAGTLLDTFGDLADLGYEGTRISIDPHETLPSAGTFDNTRPASAYDGIITTGGVLPSESVDSPEAQDCADAVEAALPDVEVKGPADVSEGEPDWFTGITTICAQLRLFESVAVQAGPDLGNDTFRDAAASLTASFALPTSPFNSLGAAKFSSPDGLRLGVFDSSVGAQGGIAPLTPLVDTAA